VFLCRRHPSQDRYMPDLSVRPPAQVAGLARNTLLNLLGQGLPLLVGVVTIPMIVAHLGAERFGILALAWAVTGYLSILDLGLGRATTKFVAESLARDQPDDVPSLVWTAVSIQAGLGLAGTLLFGAFVPFLVERALNIPPHLVQETKLTFYILSLSVPIVLVSFSFRGVLEAAQRFDLVNAVVGPLGVATFIAPVVSIWLGWGLPGTVALLVMSRVLALTAHYALCIRVFHSLRGLPRFDRLRVRLLVGYGRWSMVSLSVICPVFAYLDRFILSAVGSVAAVGYYSAPYEMVTRLSIIGMSLAATLFPTFSALGSQRPSEAFQRIMTPSIGYLAVVLGPILILVIAFARELLSLWLGNEFSQQGAVALQILAIGVLLTSLGLLPFSLIQAIGRPDVTAKLHLLELPVYLVLSWGLISRWGVTGAALSWSLRASADALLQLFAASRVSSVSLRTFREHQLVWRIVILVCLGCAGAWFAAVLFSARLRLVLMALMLSVLGMVVWKYLLRERDRAVALRFIPPIASE
jgi:O-antigen/teichoic acid export membrane protein